MIYKTRIKTLEKKLATATAREKRVFVVMESGKGYTHEGNFYNTYDEFKQANNVEDSDLVTIITFYGDSPQK